MPRLAQSTATTDRVERDALLQFLRPRHQAVLLTRRREGGVQLSPARIHASARIDDSLISAGSTVRTAPVSSNPSKAE